LGDDLNLPILLSRYRRFCIPLWQERGWRASLHFRWCDRSWGRRCCLVVRMLLLFLYRI